MARIRRTPRRSADRNALTLRPLIDRFFDEEGDNLGVRSSLPGMTAGDLHVGVDDDTLRIWGETEEESEPIEKDHYLREHRTDRVECRVTLPRTVSADGATAESCDGMLTLMLPKTTGTRARESRCRPSPESTLGKGAPMRYTSTIVVTKPGPSRRLSDLVRSLQALDCVVRYLPDQERLELEVPDDAFTWIVTGGLARLLHAYRDVVRWIPNFQEVPFHDPLKLDAPDGADHHPRTRPRRFEE